MTKRFTRHALVTAISALATASIALHAQAATDISLGHTLSSTSHYSVGAEAFKETLERLSDGAFTVTEHASGSLGGEREMIEGLQIGTVDVVITSSGPLGNFVPETYVLDLPFLFENYDQARCVLDSEIGDELLAKMSDHGLVGMAWSENGFRHLTNSQREIASPADAEGLRVRTMENAVHQEAFRQMGARPTPMAFPELFTALQQGTVDGQENPITVIVATNFWEVQDYLSLTGHVYSPAIVLGSPILLDGLSEEERDWFMQAAAASVDATREEVSRLEREGVALLEANGMTVRTEIDPAPFQQAVEPAYEIFTSQYGSDMLERIREKAGNC
ncbi:periplasmic substrate-binding transporter [Vreelandella aquamarina]|jgi:tripartite ATP-independent transporter DctP family solute receptor|uniref:Periplasmic substrate-binding transporter n=1 Tax=Vreelandella aquamarina TaxID=77097 RepID=A0A1N6CYH6_9GAMM|nr:MULTISPECIES: TRAP transporter substrate-binding protein [Halomonas]MCC4292035.1 TRAP transporter substrate-binding protein [Halomonas axialensis]MCF2914111.1 TRAP transporter substrate-binding protein [Halomonas sp. Cn5-12]MCO7242795.1 TRAP transporter substrate-binding protein [Halomonas sp. Ps84H-12]SIN63575.1 tripartite ATP-independent transporter solute receptor, DctP family [Halomonas meridiana]SIN71872.1 tripartite ATP-independent transporter solute receptor, DctP family [Halomonas m|tara:strand:+ start:1523 stop:2521 length:999 start_codon:yes stop_codon:yes gene_type:complete